jgi:hypothetical protein
MKDMKSVKVIGYGLMVIGMLLVGMPVMAQQQEWRSTSAMQTSGSTYMPQVTAVGATAVGSMATTTESYSPAKAPSHGPRKDFIDINNPGDQSDEFPVGDAVLPLMMMALAFAGVVYFRKRRARA